MNASSQSRGALRDTIISGTINKADGSLLEAAYATMQEVECYDADTGEFLAGSPITVQPNGVPTYKLTIPANRLGAGALSICSVYLDNVSVNDCLRYGTGSTLYCYAGQGETLDNVNLTCGDTLACLPWIHTIHRGDSETNEQRAAIVLEGIESHCTDEDIQLLASTLSHPLESFGNDKVFAGKPAYYDNCFAEWLILNDFQAGNMVDTSVTDCILLIANDPVVGNDILTALEHITSAFNFNMYDMTNWNML